MLFPPFTMNAPMTAPATPKSMVRRALLAWPAAACAAGWPWGVSAQLYGSGASQKIMAGSGGPGLTRLALLVGNRIYPNPFDLPPVHKNVRDLQAVLEQRGFKVTSAVDLGPSQLRQVVAQFAKEALAAPADASVLFYFTGHGMQVDAENLLLGSGINPSATESVLLESSLHFQRDVMDLLPKRTSGLTMTVIDACRTNLRAAIKAGDGFNQVEAPQGCLIAFSTGAGKPAISPSVETQNTFYTASLVKVLSSASDDITFSDMFRLVKTDVQNTMLNHPLTAIRQMAQFPFIAENVSTRVRLSNRPQEATASVKFNNVDESSAWQTLEKTGWPGDIQKLAQDYLQRFPKSTLAGSAEVALEGAQEADKAMRRNDVRLFKSAFFPKSEHQPLWQDIRKAARGDKDAAARVARLYRQGEADVNKDANRYEGWLQFAAALGNGIAAYELALYYRNTEQPVLASQFENRARELGYTPPPTLDHNRK
jgi:Caspase domain